MNSSDDNSDDPHASIAEVIAFPHSKVLPNSSVVKFKVLGMGKMADTFGAPREQQSGHWCSRCKGIWFGFLLEVECPKCGNRHG